MSKSHYLYSDDGRVYLEREYRDKQRTTRDLAGELKALGHPTYHKLVERAIVHHGIKLRNRSEAQSAALKADRAKHPTKGSPRSEATKRQISNRLKGHQ